MTATYDWNRNGSRRVRCDLCQKEIKPDQPYEHEEHEAFGTLIEHDYHERCVRRAKAGFELIRGGAA